MQRGEISLLTARLERRREQQEPPVEVLLVDDDPNYLAYLSIILSRLGFKVTSAPDADSAMTELSRQHFDLALIDYRMPRISGLELIRMVRSSPSLRHLYAMMLTAADDSETRLAAFNNGFDDFLSKGTSEAELTAKLRSATRFILAQRRLQDQNDTLYTMAITDELTGIHNRRFFFTVAEEILLAPGILTFVLFDLDRFKRINDRFGHLAGDQVLANVSSIFQDHTRTGDLVARFGGDEFMMMIAGLGRRESNRIVRRIREQIAKLRWMVNSKTFSVSVCVGIASTEDHPGATIEGMLAACDRDLYRRKALEVAKRIPSARKHATRS